MIDELVDTVATFVTREVYPAAALIDETGEVPANLVDTMIALGVIGLADEDVELVDVLRVVEALGAGSAAVALLVVAPEAATGEARDRTGLRGVRSGVTSTADRETLALAAAAAAIGAAIRAQEEAVRYLANREAFGQVLVDVPVLAATLAHHRAALDAARAALWECGATRATAGVAVAACYDAIQLHGGYGYTTEYQVERIARDCISLRALIAELEAGSGAA
jgi:alkylation response protein AidB-like acyl-CoA dehydrogenase